MCFKKKTPLQVKLDRLRRAQRYWYKGLGKRRAIKKGQNAFNAFEAAAKDLYEAIHTAVRSGKTVVLYSSSFPRGLIIVKTIGMRYDVDKIHSSRFAQSKDLEGGCALSAATRIEILEE